MNKELIFIHSLFRAGSTYFFNVFRRNKRYWCYKEPLHEFVFLQRNNPLNLTKNQEFEKMKFLRHPNLEQPYFSELIKIWPKWKDFILEENIYANYFKSKNLNFDYWKILIKESKGIPVIQECRTSCRIGVIKKELGGLHIYLYRNPWDQWESHKIDPYFDIANQMMINGKQSPKMVSDFLKAINLKTCKDFNLINNFQFYKKKPLNEKNSYMIFYLLWCLSLKEAVCHADIFLNVDKLTASASYRNHIYTKLNKYNVKEITFEDCRMPKKIYSEEKKIFFNSLEDIIHSYLLKEHWPDKYINFLKNKQEFNILDEYN